MTMPPSVSNLPDTRLPLPPRRLIFSLTTVRTNSNIWLAGTERVPVPYTAGHARTARLMVTDYAKEPAWSR